jgi:ATP-dependent Clp protease protease subunit
LSRDKDLLLSPVDRFHLLHSDLDILHEFGVHPKERTIYLTSPIEDDDPDIAVKQLHYLAAANKEEPIKLVICSPGGADDLMLYVYDAITTCAAPVHTIGTGMVCSAAALLIAAGDKRFATESCWYMTHKAQVVLSGDDDEIQAGARVQNKISTLYWRLLERHTKKSANWWARRSKELGQSWIDADKMLEFGVIDGIITNTRGHPTPSKTILAALKHMEEEEEDEDIEREEQG